jgi:hypothetical protein
MLCFVILTLFLIVILGNKLGNALETLGTPWEFRRTLIGIPLEFFGNLVETLREHQNLKKSKSFKNQV